ncbi:hypothetical protein OROGR_017386 [Orobanche gracilis]
MERFKIFEKETKTKAFSKGGLGQQPKTDNSDGYRIFRIFLTALLYNPAFWERLGADTYGIEKAVLEIP